MRFHDWRIKRLALRVKDDDGTGVLTALWIRVMKEVGADAFSTRRVKLI